LGKEKNSGNNRVEKKGGLCGNHGHNHFGEGGEGMSERTNISSLSEEGAEKASSVSTGVGEKGGKEEKEKRSRDPNDRKMKWLGREEQVMKSLFFPQGKKTCGPPPVGEEKGESQRLRTKEKVNSSLRKGGIF